MDVIICEICNGSGESFIQPIEGEMLYLERCSRCLGIGHRSLVPFPMQAIDPTIYAKAMTAAIIAITDHYLKQKRKY